MVQKPPGLRPFFRHITKVLVFLDDVILIIIALGIIGVAGLLLYEAMTDLLPCRATHTAAHIVGELMFVLIIM